MLARLFAAAIALLVFGASSTAWAQPFHRAGDLQKPRSLTPTYSTLPAIRMSPRSGTSDRVNTRDLDRRIKRLQENSVIMKDICLGCT